MTHELTIVATAWAERKDSTWRDACDRVAMGFICCDPTPERRTQMIVKYRQLCHQEALENDRSRRR